jgi:hypothetical protein
VVAVLTDTRRTSPVGPAEIGPTRPALSLALPALSPVLPNHAGGVPPFRPARRLEPGVYRRRRLLVAGVFLLAIAAVLITAQSVQAGTGGGPLTTTGAAAGRSGMSPAAARAYVVRPGDSLWTVAAAIDPHGDERPLVDALVAEVGTTSLYPGEVLTIPGRG